MLQRLREDGVILKGQGVREDFLSGGVLFILAFKNFNYIFFFFFWSRPYSLWDLSFPNRDQALTLGNESSES